MIKRQGIDTNWVRHAEELNADLVDIVVSQYRITVFVHLNLNRNSLSFFLLLLIVLILEQLLVLLHDWII